MNVCFMNLQMKYVKPITLFHDLLKTNTLERGRLLGLDVGNKYVGLAVSDPQNKIASPLSVLVRKKTNMNLMAKDFQTLISELSLGGFVIGCCYDRQRSSVDAVQVKLLVEDLRKTGKLEGVRYTYWDERFTSKSVEFLLKPLHLHPVESKTIVDKFAAVGILQNHVEVIYLLLMFWQEYLDYMNMNSELGSIFLHQCFTLKVETYGYKNICAMSFACANPWGALLLSLSSLDSQPFEQLISECVHGVHWGAHKSWGDKCGPRKKKTLKEGTEENRVKKQNPNDQVLILRAKMGVSTISERLELAKFCSSRDWSKAIRVLDSLLSRSCVIQDLW
ncbi:Resolvase [Macleaya cordata]|uniref:Resolvase n=1 Tax=Macleaya cordata TaxID=56857 RepID=A0A200R315_MACCD|nr:Resolvase [Macleaya cordata]